MTREHELLDQAAKALWNCAKAALTVEPALSEPYQDVPEWTPYTRWVERPSREAHDLAMTIRLHLRDTNEHAPETNPDDTQQAG